jgi:hypothetical protein
MTSEFFFLPPQEYFEKTSNNPVPLQERVIATEAKQSPEIERLNPKRLSRETRDRCAPRNDNI